jgi:prolyl 4-hydroxylase
MARPPPNDATGSLYARAAAAQAAGDFYGAVQLLWEGSQQGDLNCMSLLGAQLLSGRGAPPDPQTGAWLIFQAADGGGAYACMLASAIAASTFIGPPDWPRALDYLQRSAELGHAPAQDQLKLLARHTDALRAGPPVWAAMRRSVDLAAWRKAPPSREISGDPQIRAVDGFVDAQVCDWIVGRARERLKPAMVYDTDTFQPVRVDERSNSAAGFDLVYIDLVVLLVRERLAAACGLAVASMEAPQVFHYAVGQQFAPHFDFHDPAVPGQAKDLEAGGQRSHTLLVYLNGDFEGGETDFPLLGIKFKGGMGDAVMFRNVDASGAPDRRTLHAGAPPTAGEKWLLSQWVRDR